MFLCIYGTLRCPSLSDMPLHVRRSSDPALLTVNGPFCGGEPRVQAEEPPSRKNPTRWSTTAGFLKARHSSGTNSLERKVSSWEAASSWILSLLIPMAEIVSHSQIHKPHFGPSHSLMANLCFSDKLHYCCSSYCSQTSSLSGVTLSNGPGHKHHLQNG